MITKEECKKDLTVKVNAKKNKWCDALGCQKNGLYAFVNSEWSADISVSKEILPGTSLILLGSPAKINDTGTKILFKLKNDDTVYASWWVVFKHKVNYANSAEG